MGLPLSRKFAQLLGGDVHVKSEPNLGSTFYATIPIQFGGPTTVSYVRDAKHELNANKVPVLVVEDNPAEQLSIRELLGHHDIDVYVAATGVEALTAVSEQTFDCMVLDLRLPDMTGFEVLERLRDTPSGDLPVVVILPYQTGKVEQYEGELERTPPRRFLCLRITSQSDTASPPPTL